MTKRILKFGEKILTVIDAPLEQDNFDYSPNFACWIEAFLTKEQDERQREETCLVKEHSD